MADSRRLRILAFEPFDSGSHRAVRESISRRSQHEWKWITRPGRAWKWRLRLAAAEMAEQAHRQGGFVRQPDVIFATSLMSAADLRALLPRALRPLPLVLYMHENQAAYPLDVVRWRESAEHDERGTAAAPRPAVRPPDVQFALTNLVSLLAADVAIWNSQWNRRSFVDGVEAILQHAPDLELPQWRERVQSRSVVIWPPVESPPQGMAARVLHKPDSSRTGTGAVNFPDARQHPTSPGPIRILWPHRWEHDKGPHELLRIAREHTRPLNLRWTILGERFRRVPPALEAFRNEFADCIDHMEFVADRDEYWRRLGECDWVLSTARHEFFGIAVAEALLAGCLPWLPQELSYVEMLPPEARNLSPINPPGNADALRARIRSHLEPAIADNSVRAIDRAVARAWMNARSPGVDAPR